MLIEQLARAGLSRREVDVAEWVVKGLSNKEIAEKLFVTEKTIKFHLTNIYKKMSLKSRARLIAWSIPHLSMVDQENAKQSAELKSNVPETSPWPLTPGVSKAGTA